MKLMRYNTLIAFSVITLHLVGVSHISAARGPGRDEAAEQANERVSVLTDLFAGKGAGFRGHSTWLHPETRRQVSETTEGRFLPLDDRDGWCVMLLNSGKELGEMGVVAQIEIRRVAPIPAGVNLPAPTSAPVILNITEKQRALLVANPLAAAEVVRAMADLAIRASEWRDANPDPLPHNLRIPKRIWMPPEFIHAFTANVHE